MITNVLSPHPYMFWLFVGGPTVVAAMKVDNLSAPVFVLSFYALLIGTFMLIAVLVGKSRKLLTGAVYRFTMRFLGIMLLVFAMLFFGKGLKLLGVVG